MSASCKPCSRAFWEAVSTSSCCATSSGKLPYFKALGLMVLGILLIMVFAFAWWPARNSSTMLADIRDNLFSLRFLGHYLYWSILMGASMLMVRLNDQYGSGSLSYLTGRYHKPRQEMRIFMFLDMRSSTAIAEQLGHVKYFQLLNELFTDITDPIVYSRGEIYQYVGDEISVSWTLRNGVRRQRCIRCFLDIRSKLKRRAQHYQGALRHRPDLQGRLPLRPRDHRRGGTGQTGADLQRRRGEHRGPDPEHLQRSRGGQPALQGPAATSFICRRAISPGRSAASPCAAKARAPAFGPLSLPKWPAGPALRLSR